ncbi:polymorphic toxin type 47 domain-containing protein, partial [Celerinatantimonas sp. YJH-8]|uniref:polymorphic toxin type 47 domain-containing protein n=1 Tax=Celerinatantimonas sp. YJH-8 TaxID=3228714 RepID=UPI0038C8C730
RELVNEQGHIVWRGYQEVWGNDHQQPINLDPKYAANDSIHDPIECDLRYPGQIFDRETGLYYNRHRYYDAYTGQYLSPDPIGMAGGLRPQAYVHNPVDWADPLGLTEEGCRGVNKDSLSGNNWEFNSDKDLDLRGTGKSYRDGLDQAFARTGVSKEQFEIVKWGRDANGKSIPVEWRGPGGANVNMDIPELNNVKPNGTLGEGPHQPHIGYQTPGKPRVRGHIFVDNIPATRR